MIEWGYKVIFPVVGCLIYHFLDIQWFFRFFYTRYFEKKELFVPKTIKDCLVVKRRVGLRDLDIFFHMNNSRYLWHLDASRCKFFFNSGLHSLMKKLNRKSYLIAAGSTIRYRRSLEFLESYKVVSKIVYYDEKNIYIEHRFISEKDEFISAVAYVKLALLKMKPIELFKAYFKVSEEELQLDCPKQVESWINFNTLSSESLKKK